MAVHPPLLRQLDSVTAWKIYQYTLPIPTFSLQREGLILHTTFEKGDSGWGEIAPLPGRSQETLSQAREQLLSILSGNPCPFPYPSVAFGLESAFTPYAPPATPFPLWALLTGTPDQIIERATLSAKEGFRHLKIKIGHLSPSEANCAIAPLIGQYVLRIDVNRAWSIDEAIHFFSSFPPHAIAYIEEPTWELKRLDDFPFPFALDESIPEIPFAQLAKMPLLSTLIIKPSVHGGSRALSTLAQLGKTLLFTGAFESGIGTVQIALLANRLNSVGIPLGLDTYRYLKRDLLASPLEFANGALYLPQQLHPNPHELIEIAHS